MKILRLAFFVIVGAFLINKNYVFSYNLKTCVDSYNVDCKPEIYVCPPIDECIGVFNTFIRQHESPESIFSQNERWVYKRPTRGCDLLFDDFKGAGRPLFGYLCPFVQKVELPDAEKFKIIFVGDLHGNVSGLIKMLKKLVEEGVLSSDYKVVNERTIIVFLGDYSDRGFYGLEVLLILALFKLENFNNVYLLRGNHESYVLNSFSVPKSFFILENELKSKFHTPQVNELYTKILQFYEYLPVCMFLIANDACLQCCHGGFDPAYSPLELFSNDVLCFEYLHSSLSTHGFLWSDFSGRDVGGFGFCKSDRGIGYIFDLDGARNYFSILNTDLESIVKFKMRAIFRAHQHNHFPLKLLPRSDFKDLVDGLSETAQRDDALVYWKEIVNPVAPFKPSDYNPVFTLSSGAEACFMTCRYAYCVLDVNGNYENWILTPVEG